MSQLAKIRLGASSILLLTLGLVWMPVAVNAASEGPQEDPSRPSSQTQTSSNSEEGGGSNSCASLHRIVVGDTLTSIAAAYGVTLDALAEENGLDDTNLIRLDQALCIPQGGHGKQENGNGPEENSYDSQGSGYAKPGESYEPQNNSNGSQENGNGGEENSYNQQGSGYSKPGESYESQNNSNDHEENGYGYELQPGESAWAYQ